MGFYAGLDIGGSYARMAIADEGGRLLGQASGEGAALNEVDAQTAQGCYAALVDSALRPYGFSARDCLGVCAAAAGVDSPELAETGRSIFQKIGFAPERLTVVNDCEVHLFGVDGPAVVLTVGTGSIAFGRTLDGKAVRCGGWGPLLSDEGSGYDMALKALQAVGNHLDGRVQCPALFELFCRLSPLRRSVDIDRYAVESLDNKKEAARFAPLVDEAAAQGDPVAQGILSECTQAHFRLVMDTFVKLGLPRDASLTVLLWGSVLMNSKPLAQALTARLRAALPNAVLKNPEMTALEAALHAAIRSCRPCQNKV